MSAAGIWLVVLAILLGLELLGLVFLIGVGLNMLRKKFISEKDRA